MVNKNWPIKKMFKPSGPSNLDSLSETTSLKPPIILIVNINAATPIERPVIVNQLA